jgi:uncharacterized protein (TIGR01777 family)
MKILITGATGFVGQKLVKELLQKGNEVNVLTRDTSKASQLLGNKINSYEWSDTNQLPPKEAFLGINGIINLMGENIGGKRWSEEQKTILYNSRVISTQKLIEQCQAALTGQLDFFIQASAIGIYPINSREELSEESSTGKNYLAKLCKDWEAATNQLTKTKRKIILRTGVVLQKDGGALKKMLPPFLMGLGGPIGDGNQVMSWIQLDDHVNLIVTATTDSNYSGIINAVAPYPVNNFDFTKALGKAIHRPTIFPVPEIALKVMFGEMSTLMLDSQIITSSKLKELGFKFKYEHILEALSA